MSCTYTDNQIVERWLDCQPSPLTRSRYARDVRRLRAHTHKPHNQISLGDLLSFAQSLSEASLAPISRARTLAAVKNLFGFCRWMAYIESDPAIALPLPRYEKTRGKDDRRGRCRALAVRGGVAPRSRISGPALLRRPKSIRSLQPTLGVICRHVLALAS